MINASIRTILAILILLPLTSYGQEMEILARWPYAACDALACKGDIAFVGHGGVLSRVAFSDETSKLLNEVLSDGKVGDIARFDSKLYVNCGKAGLKVYSENLKLLAEKRTGPVSGMLVNQDLVIVRDSDGRLRMFNRQTLEEIPRTGLQSCPGGLLALAGDRLVFRDKAQGDKSADAFTIAKIARDGKTGPNATLTAKVGKWGVCCVHEGSLYVTRQEKSYSRKATQEIGKNEEAGLFYLERFSLKEGEEGGRPLSVYGPFEGTPQEIAIKDGLLYSGTAAGLLCHEMKPSGKSWRRNYAKGVGALAASKTKVFVGVTKLSPNGVRTVVPGNAGKITETANWIAPCNTEGVFLKDGLLYIAWNRDGLRILDVKDPKNIRQLSWLDMPNPSNLSEDVWVTGTEVYIADGTGLAIIDASDPSHPKVDKYIQDRPRTMEHWIEGVRREGDYLFVATHSALRIFDVSDPKNAHQVSELKAQKAKDTAVRDGLCHIAQGKGYSIIDVKDPVHPKQSSYLHFGEKGQVNGVDVELKDHYAFVSCINQGVHIIDFSDPEKPFIAATIDDGKNSIEGVEIDGDYLYVCTVYNRGVIKYDVSDAKNPRLVDEFDTPGAALNIKIRDGVAAVADFNCGVLLLKP